MTNQPPQYDALLLPNNEVLFRSLSRKAKVKPSYHPRFKERYHCHAAAEFAAAYYCETGKPMSHAEVKAIFQERRAKRQKGLKSMQRQPAPKPSSRRAARFTQEELRV